MRQIRLLYYSQATSEMSLSDMKTILDTARTNNGTHKICGMLCYDNNYFLQVLEGNAEEVTDLFIKIAADERHHSVVIVGVQTIDEPVFPEWDMGYAGNSEYLDTVMKKLELDSFLPPELSFKQAATLLYHLAKHQTELE